MPEMPLKQLGFIYSACDAFTKNKERIEKFMQTRNANVIYKNELDKACFQYDMAQGKSKNIAKIQQKDHNQIKFGEIKPLKLQVIQNKMVIKEDQL